MAQIEQNSETITPKQMQLIDALMAGDGVPDAADHLHIPLRTCYRWLASPAVSQEFNRRRSLAIQSGETLAVRAASLAVTTLIRLMANQSGDVSDAVQLKAAVAALDIIERIADRDSLSSRLAALE